MKGMLFGEDCERRIFYPNSQNVHLEAYLSRQRSSDPLASLGLMPSSPYKMLKTTASVRTMIARDKSESSVDQRMRTTGAEVPFKRLPGTTSLSSGRLPSSEVQQLTGDLCSPVRLEGCGSRMPKVDALIRFNGKDQSMTTLLERMRGVERATIAEATRLRRQADPNALIRRFLRRSGLPLDHVFATALRVYTRSRIRFGFSKWRAFTAAESRSHNHRIKAAITLQGNFRVYLARRTAARYRRTRGLIAKQSCVIQCAFRARQLALTRIARMHRERNEQRERGLLESRKMEACTAIQAVWRGFHDREEAKARARQELKSILIELGGGPGRIHRTQDCRLIAGCLEHLLMAEACAVVLQTAPRCGKNIREVLGLLLRCRDLLACRRKHREKMRSAWARQAEAKAVARVERERARAAAIYYRRQDYVREQLQHRERAEHNNIHEEQLKIFQDRKRLFAETADEERRERDERYLMWREEVKGNEIARKAEEWRQRREATEMVMLRREELLTKKAWALSDYVAQHELELRKDEDRIERLRRRPPVQAPGEKRRDLSVFLLESKPAAVVMERFSCTVDGADVHVTVVVRPSDECLSSFHQAAAVRATLREQDDARKQVMHWAGRSRVDTEHAASKRDEQFRLRCKTKRERQRKAEEARLFRHLIQP